MSNTNREHSQKESNLHFHLRTMAPCPLGHGSTFVAGEPGALATGGLRSLTLPARPVEPRGVEPLTPCLQGTGLTRQEPRFQSAAAGGSWQDCGLPPAAAD